MHSSTTCKNCGFPLGQHQPGTEACPAEYKNGEPSAFWSNEKVKPEDPERLCSNCGIAFKVHRASDLACPVRPSLEAGMKTMFLGHSRFEFREHKPPMTLQEVADAEVRGTKHRPHMLCKNCGFTFVEHEYGSCACPGNTDAVATFFQAEDFEANVKKDWPIKFQGREGLRKVLFTTFLNEGAKGYFHAWGFTVDAVNKEPLTHSIGIVEAENGEVFMVSPTEIKFIS